MANLVGQFLRGLSRLDYQFTDTCASNSFVGWGIALSIVGILNHHNCVTILPSERPMHTSGIDDFEKPNPHLAEEILALIEKLGECIIDEVLFKVNQELGKLKRSSDSEASYDTSKLLGGDMAKPPEGYTLQDMARYDDSIPKTLLQVTELPKKDDSTTNVDAVFEPSPWVNEHDSGKGQYQNKESSTARMIFQAPEEQAEAEGSSELFLLKELLKKMNKPLVFQPAPKRKKTEKKEEKKKYSSPSEFDLDPVKLIRMKPGGSVNG